MDFTDNELYLWIMRFGLGLILLGIVLYVFSAKKSSVVKVSVVKDINRYFSWGRVYKLLYAMTLNTFFKTFALEPSSDEFIRIQKKIVRAGELGGITPEMFQAARIGFVILILSVYLIYFVFANVESSILVSFVLLFILVVITYFLPGKILDLIIKVRQSRLRHELYAIGPFAVTMLDSKIYGSYEIIQTLSDTTRFLQPYMQACLNEFYINPRQAIQNMADKVGDEGFQAICNGLKQAIDKDKQYTALFLQQHLDQIMRMRALQREAKIKKKPLMFVLLLAPPLVSIVVIWLYPWIVRTINLLGGAF